MELELCSPRRKLLHWEEAGNPAGTAPPLRTPARCPLPPPLVFWGVCTLVSSLERGSFPGPGSTWFLLPVGLHEVSLVLALHWGPCSLPAPWGGTGGWGWGPGTKADGAACPSPASRCFGGLGLAGLQLRLLILPSLQSRWRSRGWDGGAGRAVAGRRTSAGNSPGSESQLGDSVHFSDLPTSVFQHFHLFYLPVPAHHATPAFTIYNLCSRLF